MSSDAVPFVSCPVSMRIAAVVGMTVIGFFALRLLRFIWVYFLRPAPSFQVYGAKAGKWALVTGASKGIGAEFARSLAQRGFHLVLVARSKDALEQLADSIKAKHTKCQTRILSTDAMAPDAVSMITKSLSDIDLSMLVNNVGVSEDIPSELVDTDTELIQRMVNVNITFTTLLTRALIPKLKTTGNSRSAIINLSSISALAPISLHAVYSGSKSYINHWSKCLSGELAPYNIDVLSSTPFYVKTDMSGFKRTSFMVISAKQAAEDTLNKIGAGYISITPSFSHSLIALALQICPEDFLAKTTRQKMLIARKKLLAKKMK